MIKRCRIILLLIVVASCTKSTQTVIASYVLFDSSNVPFDTTITLTINPGNNIVYNGLTWTYSAGEYFNDSNYIFLYAANNDSIYIRYPNPAAYAYTTFYIGYKKN